MPSPRLLSRIPATGWVILVITLAATTLSGLWMRDFLIQRDQQQLEFAASQLTEKINERLKAYALVLRAGAGLFAGTNRVNREDWYSFVDKLGVAESVSGVRGFGFAVIVPPESLREHEQRLKEEGLPDYRIYPSGPRDLYTGIVFLEPMDPQNRLVLGYDMFSEPTRQAAMVQARDSGQATLTGKLILVQETGNQGAPGIIVYVPVYKNDMHIDSVEQRREAIAGWVYGAFRVTELLEGILEDWAAPAGVRRAIGVSIYDEQSSPDNLLFSNLPAAIETNKSLQHEIRFNDRTWVLQFAPIDYLAAPYLLTVILVALGVLALGLLVFFLYLSLVRTQHKANTIAERLTKDLRELANQFDTIAGRVPGMVYTYQLFPDGRSCFPYASRAMQDVYGLDPATVKHDGEPVLRTLHPDDAESVRDSIMESATNLTVWQDEYRVIHPDGSVHWVLGNALPHKAEDGSVIWYGSLTRITERKEAELRLRQALTEASRFRDALDRMNTLVFMKDMDLRYTYANSATLTRFGLSRNELLGTHGEPVFDNMSIERIRALDERVLRGAKVTEEVEINIRGERAVLLQIKTPIYEDGGSEHIVGLMGISTDITKAKQQAQEIERLAHYDALTGLPNRTLLADRLNQAMAMVDRRQSSLAVVYLDLDGFKAVNDSHGHSAGDQVLITVASRMRHELREEDTLSRLGGDEFVAVLMDMSADSDFETHLERLLKAVSRPILLKDKAVTVGASLGVTFYPQPDISGGDQLIRQADQAMYQAKLSGKSRFHLFDTEQDRSLRSQHETIERMHQALKNNELCLYYQPKVNMRTSEVIGAEALLRWQHPERGLLAPGAFIGLVENTPLMLDIGRWVMDSALAKMNEWLEQGVRVPLSINISAIELRDPNFPEHLAAALKSWPDLDPAMLELEVLETAALGDLGQIARVLDSCRQLGVSIAIDDFGTGYSSLTYFKRLPAKVVKIDQSFVMGILRDPADLAILDGIVRLADALDRQLIAEGVETFEHAEMLLRIGCDLAQGYGVARPMPADDFLPWRAQWRAPANWRNLRTVSRRALPSLYAGVDHRAWVERFRSYLEGNDKSVELDHNHCGFAGWLDKQSAELPGLKGIRKLHQEVHEIAVEIDKLHRANQRDQIPTLMNALDVLSDQLSHEMETLMEHIA
ncbi:hypothetical protein B9Q17_18030 [Marinobacter vinifirmus]|uniref:EAL domain-containing protein n=1 Tax=Marinobacter vinifirmus TaxID=355591 RepID=A0A7Z1IMY0_9GAMM|nr:EAL domain-containing protein [Marinobacter vinifirmus]OZC36132.1 hypothetical protein B9Q17_18030 [Marinobacter vinifirmus]